MPRNSLFAAKTKRTVLWTLAYFAVSQLALALYLDWQRLELRDPLYGLRLHSLQNRLAESPDAPLFLILGSSRVKYGVWPAAMQLHAVEGTAPPIVYNFGLNNMGTIRELMYLRRLLADGIRPKCLLVEVWPPLWPESGFFRESRTVASEDDLHWRDLSLICQYFLKERELLRLGLGIRRNLLPIAAYRSRLQNAALPSLLSRPQIRQLAAEFKDHDPIDNTGRFLLPWVRSAEERHRAIDRCREEITPLVDPLHIDPRSDSALRALLDDCGKHGIQAALILLPEHSQALAVYPARTQSQIRDYLGGLQRDYGVPIVDARRWSADEHFADYCHLAAEGAPSLSERLGREVVQPLLAGQPLDPSVLLGENPGP